jgi:hypothetical protein
VFFFKNILDTFEKFKEFKAMVEKHSGKYIKVLRPNQGDEYDSKDFTEFHK